MFGRGVDYVDYHIAKGAVKYRENERRKRQIQIENERKKREHERKRREHKINLEVKSFVSAAKEHLSKNLFMKAMGVVHDGLAAHPNRGDLLRLSKQVELQFVAHKTPDTYKAAVDEMGKAKAKAQQQMKQ